MKHAALTLAALVTLTTLTPSSTARAQTASSTETCEVCIPAGYRAACDGYRKGLKTCRDDREQDARVEAAVRLALDPQKKLTAAETRRADRAEAALEQAPDLIVVGGVSAVVGAVVVVVVWWLAVR